MGMTNKQKADDTRAKNLGPYQPLKILEHHCCLIVTSTIHLNSELMRKEQSPGPAESRSAIIAVLQSGRVA